MENPHKAYLFLIESLRRQDVETKFLERFLAGPQNVFDQYFVDLDRLRQITDYRLTPDIVLEHMLWIVGFTSDLDYITGELSNSDKRKLIGSAVRMWKQRYIELGIENIVRFLTGRTVIIKTWFDLRWILEDDGFTIEPGPYTPYLLGEIDGVELDEYFTNIRIMDEGQLNRFLVESLLELNRPASERLLVCYLDFIDDFTSGFSNIYQWENLSGLADIVDGKMKLGEDSGVSAESSGSFDWKDYVSFWLGKGEAGAGKLRLIFGFDGVDNYHEIEVDFDTDVVQLRKYTGGTPGSVLASGSMTLVADTYYGFKLENFWTDSSGVVKFYIDDNLIFEYTPPSVIQGTIGMSTPSGSEVEFDLVELFQLPMDTKILEPGG